MSLQGQFLGGLGGLAGCGQLGNAFAGGVRDSLMLEHRNAIIERRESYHRTTPTITFKEEPDGLREELQAETDEWLKEAIK